jgi:hypothetical protein
MWNVLDMLAKRHNYGCSDKSPWFSTKKSSKSACTGKSDRFNPFMFGYLRPVQMTEHAKHLRRIDAKVYCEVGMNAGHGTAAALLTKPDLISHSFDLLEWKYSPVVVDFLETTFPGRVHVHGGSSFTTVPAFFGTPGAPKCDAMLVDGLHTEEGTRRDLLNMRAAAACNHVVFIDDLESGRGSDLAMRKMVAAGATAGTLRAHRG